MPTMVNTTVLGTYHALFRFMSDDIQNSGFSGGNTEGTRESHADSVEFTQENEVQVIETGNRKSFEVLMASLASLTLIGFLVALWQVLA